MTDRILQALKRIRDDADFEQSEDFIEDGLLDSFEIVNLVSELEDEFGIEIRGTDIIPENFMSLESIEQMVQKYAGGNQ